MKKPITNPDQLGNFPADIFIPSLHSSSSQQMQKKHRLVGPDF